MSEAPAARRRAGLRTRTSIAFAALALVLSTTLSLMTYELTRRYLLSSRESLATQEALVNADAVARSLLRPSTDPAKILVNLSSTGGSHSVMQLDGRWYAASLDVGRDAVPAQLQSLRGSRTERQRVKVNGQPVVVVAVPIGPDVGVYYGVFPLTELRGTLRTLAAILIVAAVITTLLGALVGRLASRRVLRPIETMARAATAISTGQDETRLTDTDADLAPFVHAFNEMVDALEERIDREARFASDVSHELRTPLTAMRSAVEVLDRRVDDQARPALEILDRQTRRFERLVLDLLEISRLNAGGTTLALEPVDPARLVDDVLRRTHRDSVPVVIDATAPTSAQLDPRRVELVMTNLLANADQYAGGATRVTIGGTSETVEIGIDDAGPGISPEDREVVFERFHRGEASRASTAPGTGLGLAIAAGHCQVHGGRLRVEESPDGGARFLIELPLAPP